MQLVAQGERAPEDAGQWLRVWVEEEGCIPGLMATVTLDAFERWKAAGGRQPGEEEE
jgi:mitotic spindle assembly checkpoint protein MAD1